MGQQTILRSTEYDIDSPMPQSFREDVALASKNSVPHLAVKVMEEVMKEKELPNIK